MKKTILLFLATALLSGCASTEQYIFCGDGCTIYCPANVDKPVSTSTLPLDLKARDVTVPVSAIP